ncbi:MAG: Pr6Pr family membrane protein [Ignavibacteria bacterium]|nr:Pr6Pr family membrane protein [Ignavibacteria bacterium]
MTKYKKAFLIFGSLTGCAALILQFYITLSYSEESGLTYLQSTVKFFSFMTILTNILVTLTYTIPLLSPESKWGLYFSKPIVHSGVLVYILIVGIIYHFMLAHIWDPKGMEKFVDILLHYVMPALYLLYWIFFTEKGNQKLINCIKWLSYPLIYVVYALIRGQISGMYPYPFIDVSKFGFGTVLVNIFFITVGYIVMGLIVIYFDKILSKFYGKKSSALT